MGSPYGLWLQLWDHPHDPHRRRAPVESDVEAPLWRRIQRYPGEAPLTGWT